MVRPAVAGLMLLLAMTLPAVRAQDLEKTVDETLGIEEGAQKQRKDWAGEKAELVARYRNAKANVEYLRERKGLENEKAVALDQRIAEYERRLDESGRLTASLQDTLDVVMDRLDAWVAHDLPFLREERRTRLDGLRKERARPDVAGAEKLRRLLEALQVEVNYGGTVEVNQEPIRVSGEEIHADILRIGRLSAFWRTPDGERIGEYDRGSEAWVELPAKHQRALEAAFDMAARIRPVELIALPLGRIEP